MERLIKSDILRHIEFLMSGYDSGYLEIRFINENKKRVFIPLEKYDEERVYSLINRYFNYNVFVGMLPRFEVDGKLGGTRNHLKIGNVMFFDVDEEYDKDKVSEIANNLQINFLRPSLIIASGKGYHLYYKIKEAIDIDTLEAIYQKVAEKLINLGIKIDKQSIDIARAVRLAGTVNWKHVKHCFIHEYSAYEYDVEMIKRMVGAIEVKKREATLRVDLSKKYRELSDKEIESIAIALLPFWKVGHRHNLTFTFASSMKKSGIGAMSVWKIIEKVGLLANDEELYRDRKYCVENVYKNDVSIDRMAGWSTFFDAIRAVIRDNMNSINANDVETLFFTIKKFISKMDNTYKLFLALVMYMKTQINK